MASAADESLNDACERVGRFLYHFSRIEAAIDAAIAKLFELKEKSADIITANIDFNRKLNILQSVVDLQSNKSSEWKASAFSLIAAIRGVNNPDRQIIAHSTFEPVGKNSIRFKRTVANGSLKRSEPVWTEAKFEKQFADMKNYEIEFAKLTGDLGPFPGALLTIML